MSAELKQYIQNALERGQSREQISQTLQGAGWSSQIIDKYTSLTVGVDSSGLAIPAPTLQAHHLARDLFVYVLVFTALCVNVTAACGLLFKLIETTFPDKITSNYNSFDSGTIWPIAQLLVFFPIYVFMTMWINKHLARFPQKRDQVVRKLFIYLILLVTAIIALSDLVFVLYQFLSGSLDTQFILKTLVLLGLTVGVFIYYQNELRHDDSVLKKTKQAAEAA